MRALVYNNVTLRARGEELNLTDMWRAAGSPRGKNPAQWLKLHVVREFIDHVCAVHNTTIHHIIRSTRGNGGGTWAHWQIAIAYAKYLSADFLAFMAQTLDVSIRHLWKTARGKPVREFIAFLAATLRIDPDRFIVKSLGMGSAHIFDAKKAGVGVDHCYDAQKGRDTWGALADRRGL